MIPFRECAPGNQSGARDNLQKHTLSIAHSSSVARTLVNVMARKVSGVPDV